MTLNPAEELVEIVDRDNRPIGALTRRLMREQGLIHRAAYILVFNTAGELFLQKRTLTKDIYPGYWDMAAGGVVLAGESYEAAARRELQEELGIDARLRHLCDQYYEEPGNRVWGRIYTCTHNGPFTLQAEEIDAGRFVAPQFIQALNEVEPVTPDGLALLPRLLQA